MTDPHQQIADLEAELDALSDEAERYRKSLIVAKAAVVAGILLFGASLLGIIRSDAIVLVIGIAATIAGIGFFGSSQGSLDQLQEKIRARQARRTEMIDAIDLRTVQDQEQGAENRPLR
jgi:predicted benzoate:H+ symporter BenE